MRKLSAFLILISLTSLAFGSDWKREVNGRWGFALTYPGSLIPEPVPTAGAGRLCCSPTDFQKKTLEALTRIVFLLNTNSMSVNPDAIRQLLDELEANRRSRRMGNTSAAAKILGSKRC
jgi:hypothetical protein